MITCNILHDGNYYLDYQEQIFLEQIIVNSFLTVFFLLVIFLQHRAAVSLSHLLMLCCTREPNPTPKVIRNLCTSLCCDNEQTPRVEEVDVACASDKSNDSKALSDQTPLCDCYSGIILLNAQNKVRLIDVTNKRIIL